MFVNVSICTDTTKMTICGVICHRYKVALWHLCKKINTLMGPVENSKEMSVVGLNELHRAVAELILRKRCILSKIHAQYSYIYIYILMCFMILWCNFWVNLILILISISLLSCSPQVPCFLLHFWMIWKVSL